MAQKKNFDANLIRVFLAVYRTGSVTKAAEELDLTQSSVSNALQRFKVAVNEEIFIRSGRSIKPTSFSAYLFEQINQPFAHIEQTLAGLETFDPHSTSRQFTILAGDVVAHYIQRPLDLLVKDLPIDIIFQEPPDESAGIEEKLQLEQADLVIDAAFPASHSFESKKLMSEELVCIVAQAHPRIHGSIDKEQFYKEKHVSLQLRRFNLSAVDFFTDEILQPRKCYSVKSSLLNSFETVSNSDAIGVSTRRYAQEYADYFKLQILSLPFSAKAIDIEMVWKKKHSRHPAHQWLRQSILQIIKQK
jgi:DNA-binding transcriptional LysR family regulator